jgi:proton-dependent oligopeptide transporter, POT family
MITGLAIYVAGRRYLPADSPLGATIDREPTLGGKPALGGPEDGATFTRFVLLLGIAAIAVIFRIAYEQVGNTLPLWIEHAQRQVGSFVIPATWFQSLNPLFIFLFTPAFVAHWLRRAKQGKEPSAIRKMAIGASLVACSYLLLAAVAAWHAAAGAVVSWLWLVFFFVMLTAGELYILPIGLGLFGRLAPARYAATSIALWFFAAFAGNLAAGALGTLWSALSPAGFFCATAGVAAVSAVGLLFFDRSVRAASAASAT